jgi:hypothetical protein
VSKFDLLMLLREAYRKSIEIVPYDDKTARDTRLRTDHAEFVNRLAIPDLRTQLAELSALSDAQGHWLPELLARLGLNPSS